MSLENGYLIYDFERGQWWKSNKMGYTPSVKEAGRYSYEDSISIIKYANVVNIEAEMVYSKDLERIMSIQDEVGVKQKTPLQSIINKYTTNNQYFKTNPMGQIETDLFNAGHFFEDINIPHVDYEKNEKINLIPLNGNEGLRVNLYRMPSGSYEVTINKFNPELSHENKFSKNKKKFKHK